jgi:hypothetical protein
MDFEMIYYIIKNKIVAYEQELDGSLYNYDRLNEEQSAFYELHKCSLNEVLNLKLNEPHIPNLAELKESKIEYFSQLAFDKRSEIIPDYKLINASLGIYDEIETASIKAITASFRTEFYRLKALVESANNENELNSIVDNYDSIIQ